MRAFVLSVLSVASVLFLGIVAAAQPFTHGELAWPDSAWPRAGDGPGNGIGSPIFPPPPTNCGDSFQAKFYGSVSTLFTNLGATNLTALWSNDGSNSVFTWGDGTDTIVFTNHDTSGTSTTPFQPTPFGGVLGTFGWTRNGSSIDPTSDPGNLYPFWVLAAGTWSFGGTIDASDGATYQLILTATSSDGGYSTNILTYSWCCGPGIISTTTTLEGTNCFWRVDGVVQRDFGTGVFTDFHFSVNSSYSLNATRD